MRIECQRSTPVYFALRSRPIVYSSEPCMNYWIDWVYSLSDQSFSFIYLQGQIDSNSSSLDENLVYCPWLVLTGFPQTVDSTLFKNSNVLVYILDQWIRRKWQYIGWEKRKRRFVLLSHWLRVRASPRSHNPYLDPLYMGSSPLRPARGRFFYLGSLSGLQVNW